MNKIELVIFDMDGLMLDTEKISFMNWQQVAVKYGYNIDEEVFKMIVGTNAQRIRDTFLKLFGEEFPFDHIIAEKHNLFDTYVDKHGVEVKEGLYELLEYLDKIPVKKAVATSTRREGAVKLLTMTNIIQHFDCIVCGDEIKKSKPNPEIFQKAAEKLQCHSSNCLVLEDSEAGIRAAYDAGMYSIVVPDMKEPSEEIEKLAFRKFKNLLEVKNFLQSENI